MFDKRTQAKHNKRKHFTDAEKAVEYYLRNEDVDAGISQLNAALQKQYGTNLENFDMLATLVTLYEEGHRFGENSWEVKILKNKEDNGRLLKFFGELTRIAVIACDFNKERLAAR